METIEFLYKKKPDKYFSFLLSIIVFLFSLFLLHFYVLGDQEFYISTYINLRNKGLLDGFLFYNSALSSKEFIHFLLSWIFTKFLPKNIFISIFNALLAYFASKLFLKWRVNKTIIFFTIVLNFYFIVLYTGAERLKFGILFLIISIYYLKEGKNFYIFSIISILSHAQLIIIYGGIIFYYFSLEFIKVLKKLKIKKLTLIIISISVFTILAISNQLIDKFSNYYEPKPITELIKWFIFLLMSLYYSREKYQTFAIFLVLGVATFLVGEMRVNILSYFVFLYYGLQYKKGVNVGVLVFLLYFVFKSFPFFMAMYRYGNGFAI